MKFYDYLLTKYSKEIGNKIISSFEEKKSSSFIYNSNKYSFESIKDIPNLSPHPFIKNAFYFECPHFGNDYRFKNGVLYIQDSSAMMNVELLNIEKNDIVLDLCAAPGGKSIDALLKLNNTGFLLSNEINYERAKILSSNIEKFASPNCIVSSNDFAAIYEHYFECFDKIILDVPCSGSFMFRKNKEAEELRSIDKINSLLPIQKNLLEMASFMLKSDGYISYSTCSLSPEENEDMITQFLQEHQDFEIILPFDNECFYHPQKLPKSIYLFPFLFKGEGQFITILHKLGTKTSSSYIKKDNYKSSILKEYSLDIDNCILKNNEIYAYNTVINTKRLTILRYGLHIGTLKGKTEIPSFALSHYLTNYPYCISLSEEEKISYLKGYEISTNLESNYYIIKYHEVPLTFAKVTQGKIKNTYPRGLRDL